LGVLGASQGRAGPTAIHCTPLNRLSLGASPMLDVLMVALAFIFFALSVGYTVACDRL